MEKANVSCRRGSSSRFPQRYCARDRPPCQGREAKLSSLCTPDRCAARRLPSGVEVCAKQAGPPIRHRCTDLTARPCRVEGTTCCTNPTRPPHAPPIESRSGAACGAEITAPDHAKTAICAGEHPHAPAPSPQRSNHEVHVTQRGVPSVRRAAPVPERVDENG